ncbi:MAG: helix-turn-helix domain-containing protein [Caulobacterales bacterium]|nr:helix-turn-helix domain-containing protein [Caulobacterales bacterium]
MTQLAVDRYVVETLMRDMVGHDRNPSGYLVFLWLWAKTDGGRRRHAASLQTIARETGLSKSAVQNAVRYLRDRRRLIAAERDGPTSPPVYEVFAPWRR